MHCVMYKCIMVIVWRKRKTHEVCKKDVNFTNSEGEIRKSGGKEKFSEIGGKCIETAKIGEKFNIETAKIGGKIYNFWSMTKKGSSEILADENLETVFEKVKLKKISMESENFLEIGGNLKQGGNASLPHGDGRPRWIYVVLGVCGNLCTTV